MEKLDAWMIHGFSGLINMLEQRVNSDIPINSASVDMLGKHAANLKKLHEAACQKKGGYSEQKSELGNMDSWAWRGLNGVVNLLEKRVKVIAEPMKPETVQEIKFELGRLLRLVEELSK